MSFVSYDSEEAEESVKDWLDRMVVGYKEGDFCKNCKYYII